MGKEKEEALLPTTASEAELRTLRGEGGKGGNGHILRSSNATDRHQAKTLLKKKEF